VRRVKHVHIYTYLTCVNTYITYKFIKFQTKLKKYIRKIRGHKKIKFTCHIYVSILCVLHACVHMLDTRDCIECMFRHVKIVHILITYV
jgi:hypothetical protein